MSIVKFSFKVFRVFIITQNCKNGNTDWGKLFVTSGIAGFFLKPKHSFWENYFSSSKYRLPVTLMVM